MVVPPQKDFNPRSPHGERQQPAARRGQVIQFQSTLPARGATNVPGAFSSHQGISIHAPRTGSDSATKRRQRPHKHFNPRSPHGERQTGRACASAVMTFQSTLPARGATHASAPPEHAGAISIHAPRTGSDNGSPAHSVGISHISIHAPRTGSDADGHGSR